jgi:3-methyladenine DNA glycosylase AlkD
LVNLKRYGALLRKGVFFVDKSRYGIYDKIKKGGKGMKPWQEKLLEMGEENYRKFYVSLLPDTDPETVIGVRMPVLRAFAREMEKAGEKDGFLAAVPHDYYEENLLHVIFLSSEKNAERAICGVNEFLPYVDNWAVCDSLRPAVFRKRRDLLLEWVKVWMKDPHPFTCRFGVEMLMLHFLGEDFHEWMPSAVAEIRREEYYVNMMVAWYFATALAVREKEVRQYFEGDALSPFCRRMAIRKALESRRIKPQVKVWLRSLEKK